MKPARGFMFLTSSHPNPARALRCPRFALPALCVARALRCPRFALPALCVARALRCPRFALSVAQAAFLSGKRISTRSPPPFALNARTVPSCASTARRVMESPNPVPPL